MRFTTRRIILVLLMLVLSVLFVLMITDEPAPVEKPKETTVLYEA